jgi:hypothetical protein
VKVFANASAATPPAVYFAKTFTDYPTSKYFCAGYPRLFSVIPAFAGMTVIAKKMAVRAAV